MAARAPSGVTMVIKPKPRGRPLTRSTGRLTSTTLPWAENRSIRSLYVVVAARLSTHNLVFMIVYFLRRIFDRSRTWGQNHFPRYFDGLRIRSSRSASSPFRTVRRRLCLAAIATDWGSNHACLISWMIVRQMSFSVFIGGCNSSLSTLHKSQQSRENPDRPWFRHSRILFWSQETRVPVMP